MKKIVFITLLSFLTIAVYSQNLDFIKYIDGNLADPTKTINTILSYDSSIVWLGTDTIPDELVPAYKVNVIEKNERGMFTKYYRKYYDTTTNTWNLLEYSERKYIDYFQLYQLYSVPWNSQTQQFDDTLQFYLKKDDTVKLLYRTWDHINNKFIYGFKNLYVYNPDGFQIFFMQKTWDTASNVWINSQKLSRTYNDQKLLETEITQIGYHDTAWINATYKYHEYNDNGNTTLYIYKEWDTTNNIWINKTKITYQYDSLYRITETVNYYWDKTNEVWIPVYRYLYVYQDTIFTKYFYSFNSADSSWENSGKYEYVYNSDGNILEYIYSFWNSMDNSWHFSSKIEYYYYDNGTLKQTVYSYWQDSWISNQRKTYHYADSGLVDTILNEYWNMVDSVWEPSSRTTYVYAPSKITLEIRTEYWNHDSLSWETTYYIKSVYYPGSYYYLKKYYYYNSLSGWRVTEYYRSEFQYITDLQLIQNDFVLYPNPVKETLYLKTKLNGVNIYIYDMNGRLIKSERYNNYGIFVGDLQPGTYLLKIFDKKHMMSKKFIKL